MCSNEPRLGVVVATCGLSAGVDSFGGFFDACTGRDSGGARWGEHPARHGE